MSLIPKMKTCPKCKKQYSFNPDVGKGLICPYCAGSGKVMGTILGKLSGKKKDE